ncbi:MAG: CxxC-x17-CxxC domain-containing protein [Candidatus Gracilibacteria bacterium]
MGFDRSNRGGSGGGRSFGGGNRDFGKRSFSDRGPSNFTMHKATCGDCGSSCEVPFKPSNDRPVYCSDCFKKGGDSSPRRTDDRGGDRGRSFGRDRDSGFGRDSRPEMHEATCTDCGESCEVPFRPSGDKPVFCNNCFKKGGNAGSNNKGPDQYKEQLDILNIKLDRILMMMTSASKGTAPAKETVKAKEPVQAKETAQPKETEKAPVEEKKVKASKPKAKKVAKA